jgi:hypothetical protein
METVKMSSVKVAHLRQQGQDMIIVPLDRSFAQKTENDQHATINELQMVAHSAGLAGEVVPVWDNGGGRMAFIAPNPWHPYFRSINLAFVWANVNRELSW